MMGGRHSSDVIDVELVFDGDLGGISLLLVGRNFLLALFESLLFLAGGLELLLLLTLLLLDQEAHLLLILSLLGLLELKLLLSGGILVLSFLLLIVLFVSVALSKIKTVKTRSNGLRKCILRGRPKKKCGRCIWVMTA